jgi:hypothetical protein
MWSVTVPGCCSPLQSWMAPFPCVSRVLQHLEQRRWLDHCTKALFVEFTVFNANVNLLCAVTLILESSGVGT